MEKIAPDTLAVLQRVSTDTITGQLLKMAGLRTRAVQGVRPVQPARCRMVGPAYTMRFVPIREDLTDRSSVVSPASHLYGSLDDIPPGSVVVLDMGGDASAGAFGDVLVARLIAIGVAGVVADGGMRDIAVLVVPGDIVVADPSGVAVIPRHLADRVASAGLEQERLEAWIRRRVDGGARVTGLYPPGEAALAEYQAWVAAGRPE